MIIKNKIESVAKIKELKLNTFPEELFFKNKEMQKKVEKFLEKHPAKYYAIRDKSKARGIFKLKVKKEEIMKEIDNLEVFTLNVSSINYVEHQILCGDIEVCSTNEINVLISDEKEAIGREENVSYKYNFKTNIFDKKLNKIPEFDYIYKYIIQNNLLDVIIEFTLFDIPVGINDEKIIIWELRTDY